MPAERIVTIALIQMRCDAKRGKNLTRATELIAEAVGAGARLVVLPELFLSHYFCQKPDDKTAFELAEPIPGPTVQVLAGLAKHHQIVLVGGSIFEHGSDGQYYNTTVVFDETGKPIGRYRKTHIPEDALYHEQHYFSPGDTGIRVFETSVGKIAPLICYDQWYPEAARIATLKGAEMLIYPTAIGVIDESVEANITGDWEQMWRSAQVGHAAVNNVFVAAVNRCGREGHIRFWGGSFIADPSGAVLAKGGGSQEIVLARCDLTRVAALRKAWRFLDNRRPDTYSELAKD
jgi:N-carbamoylputrescine amidase